MDSTGEQPEPPATRRTRWIAAASNRRNQWIAAGGAVIVVTIVVAVVLAALEDEGNAAGSEPRGGWNWTLDHEVTVHGHPRQQAYGPGHSLRRDIWIDSYTKGSETAAWSSA